MEHTYWEYSNIDEDQLAIGYRWEDEQWKKEPMLHDGSYGAMGGLITSIEDFGKYVSFHLSAWPPRSGEDQGPVNAGNDTLREMQTPQHSVLDVNNTDWYGFHVLPYQDMVLALVLTKTVKEEYVFHTVVDYLVLAVIMLFSLSME